MPRRKRRDPPAVRPTPAPPGPSIDLLIATAGPALSPRDERVALAVAQGAPLTVAAQLSGAGRRTVYDIVRKPEVVARIAEIRRALLAEALSRLTALAGEAVETMAELMRDRSGDVAPAVRLWASQAVLSQTLRLAEHVHLSDELAELRAQLADVPTRRR